MAIATELHANQSHLQVWAKGSNWVPKHAAIGGTSGSRCDPGWARSGQHDLLAYLLPSHTLFKELPHALYFWT
jgi:hypothetical protein